MSRLNIKRKKIPGLFLIFLAIFLFHAAAMAQEAQTPPAGVIRLDEFKNEIEKAYSSLPLEARLKAADDRVRALSRIESVRKILIQRPDSKRGPDMIQACSLLTDTALLRIKTIQNELETVEVVKQREFLLLEIKKVFEQIDQAHGKITEIEQDHASRFKADLAAERQKREQMWAEARARFSELENELIQVKNTAERTIISVSDLLFATNKYELTEALKINLARIAGVLLVFSDLRITVEGHTDNRGTLDYNQALSAKRANFIMDFLIFQGIAPGRLKFAGYSYSRPVASNETSEGRRKNRRVDLVIQKNE